jgi:hypothetical protein
VGGYLSASWGRKGSSPALEGAKLAIPYALAMVCLGWLTSIAMTIDLTVNGQGTGSVSVGVDLAFTAALALAWGAGFGALGGWIRGLRPSVTPDARAVA